MASITHIEEYVQKLSMMNNSNQLNHILDTHGLGSDDFKRLKHYGILLRRNMEPKQLSSEEKKKFMAISRIYDRLVTQYSVNNINCANIDHIEQLLNEMEEDIYDIHNNNKK